MQPLSAIGNREAQSKATLIACEHGSLEAGAERMMGREMNGLWESTDECRDECASDPGSAVFPPLPFLPSVFAVLTDLH